VAGVAGAFGMTALDDEQRYQAAVSKDPRFDGVFFIAVTSTGIYCRPSCPAITPKRQNMRFYRSAAAAQDGGFRACKRCRPDASPGSPEWNIRADMVGRAMRLIADGVVDRHGVEGLADRLGYEQRQVRRLVTAELGAGPLAMNFNFSKTTQYGDAFAVSSIQQDGFTTGTLSGVNIDTSGVVEAQYTNGQSVQLGQVALANFADPNGLAQQGNSSWAQTAASGQALYGQAGTAGLGQVESGSLEESNVDVTTQLVEMITAQRAFQANAQMISTENQITQTVIQIPTQA